MIQEFRKLRMELLQFITMRCENQENIIKINGMALKNKMITILGTITIKQKLNISHKVKLF